MHVRRASFRRKPKQATQLSANGISLPLMSEQYAGVRLIEAQPFIMKTAEIADVETVDYSDLLGGISQMLFIKMLRHSYF